MCGAVHVGSLTLLLSTPLSIKSFVLSVGVSSWTIHFQVLDESPLSGPGRGLPLVARAATVLSLSSQVPNSWPRGLGGPCTLKESDHVQESFGEADSRLMGANRSHLPGPIDGRKGRTSSAHLRGDPTFQIPPCPRACAGLYLEW